MKISSVEQMRTLDRTAIERYGIDELLLMENAGAAAFRVLAEQVPVAARRGLVLCGGGNNGGDGFVVARHIHAMGGAFEVVVLSNVDKYGDAARRNYDALVKLELPVQHGVDADAISAALTRADYVVDGLLGTGISRAVAGDYARLIERVNAWSQSTGKPVLSLDIPSGVHGDTGAVMEHAIRARWTITFGLPKAGNLLYPGAGYGGKLYVTHISFPPRLYDDAALTLAVNDPVPLPARDPDGHKSSFGQALVVAGAAGYYGAPHFAAMAFIRSGGGYARLATPASLTPHLVVGGREIVFLPQSESPDGAIAAQNADALVDIANRMDFVIVGPGLSLASDAQELVRALVARVEMPLLVDGDGLTALAQDMDLLRRRQSPTILTPHLGEMARLMGRSVADLRDDRIAALQAACTDWGATVVLKGAHSLIGAPDGSICFNLSGNSGMGSAGSGDVLTGVIAGLAGLGFAPTEAARMGVFVHGLAGDIAAERLGEDGMTAQDILDAVPHAMRRARRHEAVRAAYTLPVVW